MATKKHHLNIAVFSPYHYPYTSGVTTYIQQLLPNLAQKHSVTVYTFRFDESLPSEETINSVHIVRMDFAFKISKGFISPQSWTQFYRLTKTHDLFITNLPNVEGIPFTLLGKLTKKPVLSIFHCNVILGMKLYERILSFILNLGVFIQAMLSTKIIAYTKDYVENASNIHQFNKKIIYLLPPIPKNTAEISISTIDTKIVIGFAGRISREKGLPHLVKALTLNKNQAIPFPIELLFAGPYGKDVVGEEHHFDELKHQLTASHIKHTFLGNLHKNDLQAFYEQVHILVLPSINSTEAFGMVQAEAMMAGTPVICTDLPGVRQPITLTGMGIVVQPNNPQAIMDAIQTIMLNYESFTNIEKVQHARDLFDESKTYKEYDTILNNL